MNIKELIIKDGRITIDSIFRFEDDPFELISFLEECNEKNCSVTFVHEKLVYTPGGHLSREGYAQGSDVLLTAFVTYMQMHKKYFLKHMEYKLTMEKNEGFYDQYYDR